MKTDFTTDYVKELSDQELEVLITEAKKEKENRRNSHFHVLANEVKRAIRTLHAEFPSACFTDELFDTIVTTQDLLCARIEF